eukprot:14625716-Alexandrium_andersonii.AAC.1
MSASLVGSEMCIRDRGAPRMVHNADSASPKTAFARFCDVLSCFCVVLAAVSYTHLTLPTICSV